MHQSQLETFLKRFRCLTVSFTEIGTPYDISTGEVYVPRPYDILMVKV